MLLLVNYLQAKPKQKANSLQGWAESDNDMKVKDEEVAKDSSMLHICLSFIYTQRCIHAFMYIHTYIHTYIYVYIYIQMHVYIYA